MGAISSINFKKSNAIQTRHNDRDLKPNYLISDDCCEVNRKHREALKLRNQIIKNAIETYNEKKSEKAPKFKAKSYEWSAVVNIKSDTTMQDLERLAEHFEQKYGFQCYQIAIHRDEGYIENGEKHINHHAHLEFITLDKNTGKSMFRAELQRAKALSKIQTEVAEILGMQRGEDKQISKRERIEPRKYAQLKEQERKNTQKLKQDIKTKDNVIQDLNQELEAKDQELEDEKLSKKRLKEQIKQEAQEREHKIKEILYDRIDKREAELKEKDKVIQDLNQELEQEKLSKAELKKELEQLRVNSKNQGFSKEFFQEINLEKKKLRFDNKKELETWFQNLVEKHTKKGIFSNQVDNEAIFEEMYKVYQEPYKKIEIQNAEISELKAEKQRFHELLEQNPALKEAYNHALKALEEIKQKRTGLKEKIEKWQENNKRTLDKIEHSEQDQKHNKEDELGIDKILIHKNEDKTQEDNKPKIRKYR